jgi:hypothetical protein
MRTLLLLRFTENDTSTTVSRSAEALAESGSFRSFVLVLIVIGTVVGLRLGWKAVSPIAGFVKSVVAAGLSALLMTAVVTLAVVLAITSV